MLTPFHLAIHVHDLEAARAFYGGVLGCAEGRSAPTWVDFDFFGHQLSLHLGEPFPNAATGRVGEKLVPMPHFGLVLHLPAWQALAERLRAAGGEFVLAPQVRWSPVRSASGLMPLVMFLRWIQPRLPPESPPSVEVITRP